MPSQPKNPPSRSSPTDPHYSPRSTRRSQKYMRDVGCDGVHVLFGTCSRFSAGDDQATPASVSATYAEGVSPHSPGLPRSGYPGNVSIGSPVRPHRGRAQRSGGPPPLEGGDAMIVGMSLSVCHRLTHVQRDMGHPSLFPAGIPDAPLWRRSKGHRPRTAIEELDVVAMAQPRWGCSLICRP